MPRMQRLRTILALFVNPERATAIISDVLKSAGDASSVRLIWLQFYTVAREYKHGLLSRPVLNSGIIVLAVCLSLTAFKLLGVAWMHHPIPRDFLVNYLWFKAFQITRVIVIPFAIGLIVSRLSPNREMTLCLAMGLIFVVMFSLPLLLYQPIASIYIGNVIADDIQMFIACCVAGLLMRWRGLEEGRAAQLTP